MRRREYYWSIFHRPNKNQLDDLRTDQVEAIFAAVPQSRHVEYLIWKDGLTEWKAFTEFPALLISLRSLPGVVGSVPAPNLKPNPTSTQTSTPTSNPNPNPMPTSAKTTAKTSVPILTSPTTSVTIVKPVFEEPKRRTKSKRNLSLDEKLELLNQMPKTQVGSARMASAADRLDDTSVETEMEMSLMSGVYLTSGNDESAEFTPFDVTKIDGVQITSEQDEIQSGMALSIENQPLSEDRDTARYPHRLAVRIVAGDICIQTTTVDISTNGMRLAQVLPSGLPRYFNVELQLGGKALPLICSEVRMARGHTNRLRIEINESPDVLQSLLIAG